MLRCRTVLGRDPEIGDFVAKADSARELLKLLILERGEGLQVPFDCGFEMFFGNEDAQVVQFAVWDGGHDDFLCVSCFAAGYVDVG